MAYNRTFNPDALPKFAEPDRKQPPTQPSAQPVAQPSLQPISTHPPRGSSQNYSSAQHEQYGNKPPPPLPRQDNSQLRSNSYEGSGQRRQHSPEYRSNTYGGTGLGRQQAPMAPQQINYTYSSSPPSTNTQFRPAPQATRPPISPAPGGSTADPSLLPLFRAVDKTGSGQLTEKQLGAALVNGDWSPFDPHTVHLMIRMFDSDGSGTIGFEEFCGLWSFLASWRTLFDRFDVDRSGNISLDEFSNALTAFGYRLSPEFVQFLFSQYDKHRTNQLSFDLFVQSCISLKRMTDVFKRYDDDRDGFIQLSFEDFLTEILRQR